MTSRCLRVVAALIAGVLVLGGCSSGKSDNGEASKSAPSIFADATASTSSLKSVHVSGNFGNGAFNSIDLDVGQSSGGGSVLVNKQPISVFADQNGVYLNASPSTWLSLSKNPNSQRLGDRWVEFPSGSAMFVQFGVNGIQKLITNTLNQDPKTLTKGTTTAFRGQKAIPLHSGNQTIYVAAVGPPYLLGIESTGSVTFDQFNSATVPAPPASWTPAANLIN